MILTKLLVYKNIFNILSWFLENEKILILLYKNYLISKKSKQNEYYLLKSTFFSNLKYSKIIKYNISVDTMSKAINLNKKLKIVLVKVDHKNIIINKYESLIDNKLILFNILTSNLGKSDIDTNIKILKNYVKDKNNIKNKILLNTNNNLILKIKELENIIENNKIDLIIYKKENNIIQNKLKTVIKEKDKLENVKIKKIKGILSEANSSIKKRESYNSYNKSNKKRLSQFLLKNLDVVKDSKDYFNFIINIEKNNNDDSSILKKYFYIEMISKDDEFSLIRDIKFTFINKEFEVIKYINEYENGYNSWEKNQSKRFNFVINFKYLRSIKKIDVSCNYKIDLNKIGETIDKIKYFSIPFTIDKIIDFNIIDLKYFNKKYLKNKKIEKLQFCLPFDDNFYLFDEEIQLNNILRIKDNYYIAEFNILKDKIGLEFINKINDKLIVTIYKDNLDNLNEYQWLLEQCLLNNN